MIDLDRPAPGESFWIQFREPAARRILVDRSI